jgi:hypothetical protein
VFSGVKLVLLASFIPEQKIKAPVAPIESLQQPTFRRRTSIRERMKPRESIE